MRYVSRFAAIAAVSCCSVFICSAACARPLSEKVTERVVDSAIDAGLDALSKPENQQRLGTILSSKAVTGGVHDIAYAIVDGVLDGVEGRIKLPELDTSGFWKGFDAAARKHVGPAVASVTRSAVDAAMDTALSERNGERIESLAAHATHGVIKGLAQGIREDLAPALAYSIAHDLAPAGAIALEQHIMPATARALSQPEMQGAIALTMSSVARSLVRGGDAGIASARANAAADGESGPFELIGDRVSLGLNIGLIATLGIGGLMLLLVVLLVRSARRQQRLAEQGRRRDEELLAMLAQMDNENTPVDRASVRSMMQRQLERR